MYKSHELGKQRRGFSDRVFKEKRIQNIRKKFWS